MRNSPSRSLWSRRQLMQWGMGTGLATLAGCVPQNMTGHQPVAVWGRRGFSEGRFQKARAIVVSPADELYIVDKMGRIQVFDNSGNYRRGWNTPEIAQGKPVGLGWSNDGALMVADTHYYRVLFYSSEGHLLEQRTIGGQLGDEPGHLQFVTDVVQTQQGHYLVGQYGQIDRIQEFDEQGNFLRMFGSQGDQPGQFSRPQALMLDRNGHLWVADACNHRIQQFDLSASQPKLINLWGSAGSAPGKLQTPYALALDQDGTILVCEYANHRIQRFSPSGQSLDIWGGYGQQPGQFLHPWAVALDSKRQMHVVDSENYRMQLFQL